MNNSDRTFPDRGWAFPPVFDRITGEVKMVAGSLDIRQSIDILLHTYVGERFLVPDFGCDLHPYVFDPLNKTKTSYLYDLIKNAIRLHEPRIELTELVLGGDEIEGRLFLQITYTEKSTGITQLENFSVSSSQLDILEE